MVYQPTGSPGQTEAAEDSLDLRNEETSVVQADRVVMTQSAAREVSAREARLERSAAVVVESNEATVNNSACVQVLADQATVVNTPVLMLAAERAHLRGSPVFLFLGSLGEDSTVRPTLDWRAALGLGAGLGAGLAMLGWLLRRR